MRVLHLMNHIQRIGNGIVNVAVDLACVQSDGDATVAVASNGGDYDGLLARHAVKLINFDQRARNPKAVLMLPWRWRSIIREFRPDIVHAHMVTGAVIARAFRGSSTYRLVTTVHNEHEGKSRLMNVGDRVIAVSRSNMEALVNRGLQRAKLRVVVNGTLGSPRSRSISTNTIQSMRRPAILTVAGLYERKGIADLIHAFEILSKEHPGAHLYIAGDGPDRKQFETLAQSISSKNRIHFLGFQDSPQTLMRSADAFVLASRREPFGLVITEAMEAGCPVIGSDVDGIPEILGRNSEYGILTPASDPQKLAAALDKVLASSAERTRLSEAGRERANAFTVARVATETNQIYEELLRGVPAMMVKPSAEIEPIKDSLRPGDALMTMSGKTPPMQGETL